MRQSEFSAAEIAMCKAAMDKPAPRAALALIASGRLIVELTGSKRDVLVDRVDGRKVRDGGPDRKMFLAGAWPLYRAGMIDEFGVITDAGRARLAKSETEGGAHVG